MENIDFSKYLSSLNTQQHKALKKAMDIFKPYMLKISQYLNNHQKIFDFLLSQTPIIIGYDDKMNHAVLREAKPRACDFINSLSLIGLKTNSSGEIGLSKVAQTFNTSFGDSAEVTTRIINPSESERRIWLYTLHSFLLYHRISQSKTIVFEMDEGEGPPTQAMEDLMISTEVVETSQNTKITKEVDDSENAYIEAHDELQLISTTERLVTLEELTTRNIRLVFDEPLYFQITDVPNQEIFSLDVPNGLYKFIDTTISTAMRNFTIAKMDIEFTVKINANQAQCGMYIMSHYPCYDQLIDKSERQDNVWKSLMRDHAIIDLSKSNDVKYTIRYENLRPFVPIQSNEIGEVTGGNYARVFIRTLSRLRIADTGNPRCPLQIIARFIDPKTSGMRYSIPTVALEMGERLEPSNGFVNVMKNVHEAVGSVPLVGTLWKALAKVGGNAGVAVAKMLSSDTQKIKEFENDLMYIGFINKDRPLDISHPKPLMPQPIHSYAYGRGPFNAKKLRLEPESTTPHCSSHGTVNTTESFIDIAQIPGLWTSFMLSTTNVQGDTLIELPCIPYDPRYSSQVPAIGSGVLGRLVQLPPVSYISGMFNDYAGNIVYEFRAVKTPAHNFSIQVAFVPFTGTPGETTEAQLQSCTWKVIDFRSSSTGQFTVPWLSTSVMRNWPYAATGLGSRVSSTNQRQGGYIGVNDTMTDPGRIVVKLVNSLNPTPIVSPDIEILVFMKAHSNLRFLSPCQPRYMVSSQQDLTDFTRLGPNVAFPLGTARIPLYNGGADATGIRLEMGEVPTFTIQQGDELILQEDEVRQTFGPQIQTMEKHDNMLDVFRRATYWGAVTATRFENGGEILRVPPFASFPVTPYSLNTYAGDDGDQIVQTDLTSSNPIPTTKDLIALCHRWFRGSLVYNIHIVNDFPVEVTYIPPLDLPNFISGGLGEKISNKYIDRNAVAVYASPIATAYATEVIDPRVNPLLSVEAPMYNTNNYIDLQSTIKLTGLRVQAGNYPLQDALATTNGQIVIRQLTNKVVTMEESHDPNNGFKARINMSFGDDARFYHFLGVPPVWLAASSMWTMTKEFTRVRTRAEISTSLIASGIESNPGPSTSAITNFFNLCSSGVTKITDTAANILNIKNFLKDTSHMINKANAIKDSMDSMLDQVRLVIATYAHGIDMLQLTALSLTLIEALKETSSALTKVSLVLQLLSVTGVFHQDAVSRAITSLTGVFDFSPIGDVKHESIFDTHESIIGIVTALLVESYSAFTKQQHNKDMYDTNYVTRTVTTLFQNFNFARAGAICLFFTRICHAIKLLYKNARKWIIGIVKYDLLANDPRFLEAFMVDYAFFMNEINTSQIMHLRRHRDRYWTTVIVAYYIKGLMATIKDNKYRNNTLLSAVNDVIRRANDLKSAIMAPPVRYEPFISWFYGPAGVGKSYLHEKIAIDMLKAVNVKTGTQPVYQRNPNDEYWNGYTGEPITAIDDANAVNDPNILGRALSEFQALKSPARMKLTMARLEEKNTEMTSLIGIINSNMKSWKSSMIVTPDAFSRRRDLLTHVDFSTHAKQWFDSNGGQRVASRLPSSLRDNNLHLSFRVCHDPTSEKEESLGTDMSYINFHAYAMNKFRNYHEKEMKNIVDRYKKSLELSEVSAAHVMDERTLRIALQTVLCGSLTPKAQNEMLIKAYNELKEVAPSRFRELPAHTQYLIGELKKRNVSFEANMTITPEIYKVKDTASSWFKNVAFSTYFAQDPSSIHFIKDKFMPWNTESAREFDLSDRLVSQCTVCSESHSDEREVGYICANSVESAQHWMCIPCSATYERTTLNTSACPTCRDPYSFLKTFRTNVQWRVYHKIAHVLFTASTVIKNGIINSMPTFETLWQNAALFLALTTFAMKAAYLIRSNQRQNELMEEYRFVNESEANNIQVFASSMGVIPDNYYTASNGETLFTLNDCVFAVQGGEISLRSAYHDMESDNSKPSTSKMLPSDKFHTPTTSDSEETLIEREIKLRLDTERMFETMKMKNEPGEPQHVPIVTKILSAPDSSYTQSRAREISVFTEKILAKMETVPCNNEHESNLCAQTVKRHSHEVSYKGTLCVTPHNTNQYLAFHNIDGCWVIGTNCMVDGKFDFSSIKFKLCENSACRHNKYISTILKYYLWYNHEDYVVGVQDNNTFFIDKELPECIKNEYLNVYNIRPIHEESRYVSFINYQTELLIGLKCKLYEYVEKMYEVVCDKWYWIVTIVIALFAMYKGYKYYFCEDDGIIILHESDDHNRNVHHLSKQARNANTRTYYKNIPKSNLEMNLSLSTRLSGPVKNISDMILKQVCEISCGSSIASGFVLYQNHVLFPRHAVYIMSEMQRDGMVINLRLSDGTTLIWENNIMDSVIIDGSHGEYVVLFHKRIVGKDIRHHIYTTPCDTVTYASYAYAVDIQDKRTFPVSIDCVEQIPANEAEEIILNKVCGDKTYSYTSLLCDYLRVIGLQGAGKCGSPILSPEGKIIGIHFAGAMYTHDVKVGYSVPIFRENFLKTTVELQLQEIDEPPQKKDDKVMKVLESGDFENLEYYAKYPNPPFHTTKSRIQPSCISAYAWESLTIPCIQSAHDKRYTGTSTPLFDGAATIGAKTIPPICEYLHSATYAVCHELISKMPAPTMKAPVSMSEAILAENHRNVESMNLNTSAGLPLIADMRHHSKKGDYIYIQENEYKLSVTIDPNFKKLYISQWKQRKQGIPPREPFWAHLKDERRKPLKALAIGGTRVFNVSPLELIISSRRVLLPFMDAFHSDPVSLHHAIGIAPDSFKWTHMVNSLYAKSNRIIQLDFSKFSDSMPWEFVSSAFYVISQYYTHHGVLTRDIELVLYTLYTEITQSLVCIGSDVFELKNGVLQGHPLTSIINSIVNMIEQVYVWEIITKKPGIEFFRHCALMVMGDDVVISVPEYLLGKYNGKAIARVFSEMLIQVTDENKDPLNISPYQDISQLSFLSRSFQIHPYRSCFLSPSDVDSVFDSALWIKRKDGPFFDASIENMEQSLMLMFGHGPFMYEMYRALLVFLLPIFDARSWFDLDFLFYGNYGIPEDIVNNKGIRTGLSPGKYERLQKDKHLMGVECPLDFDFAKMMRTQYRCTCRYNCEEELMERISIVERKTGIDRSHFLPFCTQLEGNLFMGFL